MNTRKSIFWLSLLIFATFVSGLAACWIIPFRLGFGAEGSWFTFGYIGDEYTYAQRIQPLISGATTTSPLNGICDPQIISQFYLEDAIRCALTLLKIDVISFIWTWRFVFPIALASLLVCLARACLSRRRKPWSAWLQLGLAATAFPLLYAIYDLVTPETPLYGWLNRIPTNIEWLLSILLAYSYIRFLKMPSALRATMLALATAALIYLRLYAAIPWLLAISLSLAALTIKRAVSWRATLIIAIALLLALAPWSIIAIKNSQTEHYAEIIQRYFGLSCPTYQLHPKWLWFSAFALIFALLSKFARTPWRTVLIACAATMVILIFVCALLPFGDELLLYDRFGSFYLIAMLVSLLLRVDQISLSWRGKLAARRAQRIIACATMIAITVAVLLAMRNAQYNFARYPSGPYAHARRELNYIPAYLWMAKETSPTALTLVDDGFDWQRAMNSAGDVSDNDKIRHALARYITREDLFSIVARRRRVYYFRLYGDLLTTHDYKALRDLHFGAFGCIQPCARDDFQHALARFQPDYILWRKSLPFPRNFGATILQNISHCVYSDAVCEIWQLKRL